jgi:hypothetical protein
MPKIKDRLMLGCVSGLTVNVLKSVLCMFISRWGISCPERAAAFFVPAKRVNEPVGRVVGVLADGVTACLLGVANVYMLSATGKDRAITKGAGLGAAAWYAMWGGVTSLGVSSKTRKVTPSNALAILVTNVVFGTTASWVATKVGDPGLFNGEIPWFPRRQPEDHRALSVPSAAGYERNGI